MDYNELEKAYEAQWMLKELNLPENNDLMGKIARLEQTYLREDVIPLFKQELEPLLCHLHNDVTFSIVYNKEDGLKIDFPEVKEDGEENNENKKSHQDRTKYSIDGGEPLNKRRFVWAVVKKYVEQHPDVTYDELVHSFPPSLSHSPLHGVFQPLELIEKKILKQPDLKKRFMLGPDEIITLSDGIQITVYNQWGTNFDGFLRVAQRLFEVKSCG